MGELKLMKGNEVIAEAAIRCGCDGYFGYPITPQSEVMETLMAREPWNETGMVVLQAESEVASINMVYGAAATGKKVMTSSSSPGISLMAEGISYIAGAELPCVIVNVQRGGPGLGTIQPSQADYFQSVKGGGHGDYHLIVLAPASVQEMNDFVDLGFQLAFKYRNPSMILADGAIGQMMEKVQLSDFKPRMTAEEIDAKYGSWATNGKKPNRERNIATSLEMDSAKMEANNKRFQEKYAKMQAEDVLYETIRCDDAEYILVAFGVSSRICQKAVDIAREKGMKVGLLRPITLFPFPKQIIGEMAKRVKGFMTVEMNAGQMIEDVQLSVGCAGCAVPVKYFGRMGGIIPTPSEVVQALEQKLIGG
ncbi:MAG: 3-methyl-2-oxobutanoate dehydrogenase subunit VorB [Bacteroidetes bacterium GWF2_42_66]|nr:MAG: 3-methyl-2-oxobutanoate dehydrogenase subunit VorB [Bacteroidetes bacterium GWA2_42_15]OFY01512.1 MAG: 3-methyl-2-oxobutanoate dehydrogenase subunit VorB [Bacteroidetes bacterium GWE2_42_39]OFY43307.1 MAG: 3-methyl-2-oxobutanoate dehydrogenase subunit VorB [Bacteroidetes bacterium GWF2_42_66]HBL77510.1 3-methyl-2-oxobutanoate dehydrogenase subunit beta [Prolixibacteraceae bacterium]HCU61707.1 3-methyl-2-oxobutanoate dehydrogenase subunit beta [Prolixibacteraceae bacterium]